MISIEEARRLVMDRVEPCPPVNVSLAEAVGHALAEDVKADIDSPPHAKALVDGYAVRVADLRQASVELQVVEEVTAGQVPTQSVAAGQATRIMTGAPIPSGTDAVVMREQTELRQGQASEWVTISTKGIVRGTHILELGASFRKGEIVSSAGTLVRGIEVGLLGEVGCAEVKIVCPPRVAILATGNELVHHAQRPDPGQIRNSNGPMLVAMTSRAGAEPVDLGIACDDHDELAARIRQGLDNDILLLSGGVSAGRLDLVPEVLSSVGVQTVFHRVRLKPGKPLWFGAIGSSSKSTLVFGLPGNPVSGLVCFELFVRPAIEAMRGRPNAAVMESCVELAGNFSHRGGRPTYHPGQMRVAAEKTTVLPLQWQGSADLRALTDANCLIHFPAGERSYGPGELVKVRHLDPTER